MNEAAPSLPSPPALRGFSLVELLAVMAILSLLFVMSAVSITNLQRSQKLVQAATEVKESLQLARQFALTRNQVIVASFCQVQDELGSTDKINALRLDAVNADGTFTPISKMIRFPTGFSVWDNAAWSTLNSLSKTNLSFQGSSVPCYQFGFRPSGRTTLASTNGWFFTIRNHQTPESVPKNFVTLVVDPVTGRITWNQP